MHVENYAVIEYVIEIMFVIILPLLTFTSILLNILCVIVFSSNEFQMRKHKILYKYFKVNGLVDSLVLTTLIFVPLTQCRIFCKVNDTYWPRLLEIYIFLYLCRVLSIISSLLNIKIAYDRCKFMLNELSSSKYISTTKNRFNLIIFLITVIPFIFCIPILVFTRVIKIETVNSTEHVKVNKQVEYYVIDSSKILSNNSIAITYFFNFIQYSPTLCFIVIMFVLNIVIIVKFKCLMRRRFQSLKLSIEKSHNRLARLVDQYDLSSYELNMSSHITRDSNSGMYISRRSFARLGTQLNRYRIVYEKTKNVDNKLTSIIIWMSTLYLILQIVISFAATSYLFISSNTIAYKILMICLHTMALVCYCSNFFIFYIFDKGFARKCRAFFTRFKCKCINSFNCILECCGTKITFRTSYRNSHGAI